MGQVMRFTALATITLIVLGSGAPRLHAQAGVPSPPSGLNFSVVDSLVTLSWNAPSGGEALNAFVIDVGTAPGLGNIVSLVVASTVTSLAASAPNGTYYVRVLARSATGTSVPSNEVVISVGAACMPAAPANFGATVTGSTVVLTWLTPAGTCAPTTHIVEAGSASGLANLAQSSTGNTATTFTASSVPPGTYFLRVRGGTTAGVGPASAEWTAVVGGGVCAAAPAAPTGLTVSIVQNIVFFSWTQPAGAVTRYVLEAGSAPGQSNLAQVATASAAPSFAAAAPNGTYYVRVRAQNACGVSAPSAEITVVVGGSTETGLMAGAVLFTGPYPAIAQVGYTDRAGRTGRVPAFAGQVQVFFTQGTSEASAVAGIQSAGGTVIERIPVVGYYMASVVPGTEGAAIAALHTRPGVTNAVPNMVGVKARALARQTFTVESLAAATAPGATLFETCDDAHFLDVKSALEANGGLYKGCRNLAGAGLITWSDALVDAIVREANESTGPVLVNMSSYGTIQDIDGLWINGDDYFLYDDDARKHLESAWKTYMQTTLEAIAGLPASKRAQFVMTICAGNNHMPISDLLTELRSDPRFADILANNVIVVSTTQMLANYSYTDPDVLNADNEEAVDGSSLAAPGAMGILQGVMEATGATARIALLAAKQAARANADHRLVPTEAISAARAIMNALNTDPTGASTVTAIALTQAGTTTQAVVTPPIAGVSVRYAVSGSDGYFDSGTLPTNASGVVVFAIPAGASGVVDTISVTAVVSGKIASTTHSW